ncbi:MAG: GrpB family protein [Rhodobacteraceae bacterium]|nr:GrpB family protein [Paracoccaceae bacterium]
MSLIVAPDPAWPLQAQREIDRWQSAGMAGLVEIHHIGSTSVPGLSAKPIIDLLPVFSDLSAMESARARLETLGYEWLGEFGLPGRRYVRLDDPDTGTRQFQAHCYVQGSSEITRHLAFRDALRANAPLRAAYSSVKATCAARHPGDYHAYGDCKSGWIQKAERKALEDLA